ncbi:protein kinase superfamily protein [Artemisia annua]|uniref:Protein kinase superfamily protein n=1 Tax=Artemisia annua TaxID=35608 RepID=A0A2U1LW96_ARTAN|nr:protein kinase superfamily protein [Artemisia annua]
MFPKCRCTGVFYIRLMHFPSELLQQDRASQNDDIDDTTVTELPEPDSEIHEPKIMADQINDVSVVQEISESYAEPEAGVSLFPLFKKRCFVELKSYLEDNSDCARLRVSMEVHLDVFDTKKSIIPTGIYSNRVDKLMGFTISSSSLHTRCDWGTQNKNIALMNAGSSYDNFQPRNTLYTHVENGHALLILSVLLVFEGIILLFRAMYLAILFSPSMAMAPFAESSGASSRQTWLTWAATRPDLFPTDLCTELSKLHSKAPEHSFAHTKKTVEKPFGRKISKIFDDFEEVPVESRSFAQIHRASLI